MPGPRCTDHLISVGEYTMIFIWYRAYYRKILAPKYKDKKDLNEAVAAELVTIANDLNIMGPCCRHQLLNVDTLYDFMARRDTY
jgi:hypothetical protein